MSTAPPLLVTAPPVTPSRFGLLSVADPQGATDPHVENGVEYEPLTYGKAASTNDPCRDGATATAAGTFASAAYDVPRTTGTPFTIYAGVNARLVGRSQADFGSRAEAALAVGEGRAIEYTYWTGVEGNTPRLADPSAVVVQATAAPLVQVFAELEDYLAKEYGGEGVLHMPRSLAVLAFEAHLLEREGARLVTRLGTRVAAGGGYSAANTSPAGVAAAADTAWVYATGAVAIWRSAAFALPGDRQKVLSRSTNDAELLVARTVTVTHDQVLAAGLVGVTL